MLLRDLPPERWSRFSALLDEALALPAGQRAAWLAAIGGDDAELAPLLRSALQADDEIRAGSSEGRPRIESSGDEFGFQSGQRLGAYELMQPLGRGGMGEVWLARRIDGTLTREVALKLPHTWLMSAGQRLRLSRERDILAGLTHPNITQLFDAGITESGQPWLALEKVDGQRIDEHCRAAKLSLPARLALFAQVLDAVQAAHARLIVHRDIKPANILVTAQGQVKLLDFGIAKLIDEQGTGDATEITQLAGRALTPDYAAPEQLAQGTITVATDVYALGVVLYELLSGQRPYATRRLRADGVGEHDLPLASAQIKAGHAETLGLAPRRLRQALSGDLDAILVKALAPQPSQRYASVEQLAEDLRRHQRNQPIAARHITRRERTLKFLRRNRLPVGVAALFVVTLSAGVAASLWQARLATEESQRANASRDFLLKVLTGSQRLVASDRPAGSATAREMLDDIVDRLDTELDGQPQAQIELLGVARKLYRQWYASERGERVNARYRELVEQVYGAGDPRIIESLVDEAAQCYEDDVIDHARIDRLMGEARRLIDTHDLQGSLAEAEWLRESGRHKLAKLGPSPQAVDELQRAIAIFERLEPQGVRLRWPTHYLVFALLQAERADEAFDRASKGIALERTRTQRNDWYIAAELLTLGNAESARGHADAALAAYRESVDTTLATFGIMVDNYYFASAMQGRSMDWTGDWAGAEQRLKTTIADGISVGGDLGEGDGIARLVYAELLIDHGRASEALPLLQSVEKIQPISTPPAYVPPQIALAQGEALSALGRTQEAGEAFARAHQGFEALGVPAEPRALLARERLARFELQHGDIAAAQAGFERVLALTGDRPLLAVALARMGQAELAMIQQNRERARQLGDQALADLDRVRALYNPRLRPALAERRRQLPTGP